MLAGSDSYLRAPATRQLPGSRYQWTHDCFRTSAARVLRRQWEVLKPDIFACIMDFYNSGQPLILEGATGLSGAGALIAARSSSRQCPATAASAPHALLLCTVLVGGNTRSID